MTDQMYTAALGLGAKLNGKHLAVNKVTGSLRNALVLTELGVNLQRMQAKISLSHKLMTHPVHAVHMLGCASLSLCLVASGCADAYVEEGIKCWDIAAGVLILREAGGWVSDFNGNRGDSFELSKRQVLVACSEKIGTELLKIVQDSLHPTKD